MIENRFDAGWVLPFALFLSLSGCGSSRPEPDLMLPPIPLRTGPLSVDVVYPPAGSRVAARDSNFIFGSVGDGRATLTINGHRVSVRPNGAFLAWLPLPAGDTVIEYELVAAYGPDTVAERHTVRLPVASSPLESGALIDSASLSPRGLWWARPGERVPVRVRARHGSTVRLHLPGAAPLVLEPISETSPEAAARWRFGRLPQRAATGGSEWHRGAFAASVPLGRGERSAAPPPVPAGAAPSGCGALPPSEPAIAAGAPDDTVHSGSVQNSAGRPAREDGPAVSPSSEAFQCAIVEVATDRDTTWLPLRLDLWVLEGFGPLAEVRESPSGFGRDGLVVGRPAPAATYAWLWSDGVRARVTGRRNDAVRIALDGRTEAWVAFRDLVWPPETAGPAVEGPARVGTVRLHGTADRVAVRVAVEAPVPYAVHIEGQRLSLTLYGAYSDTDWLRYGPADPFVERASWEQPASDRYVLHLDLAATPWGYRARHRPGVLALDIRKPPAIDPQRPLAGRTIAIDPGHPPAGATGPTRLYEGDANLAVAYRIKRRLESAGATVYLVRSDQEAVRLYDRPELADLLDAELIVSIHNNALPDGVNPYENHGTSVYYFHDHETDLARALQSALLETMGLDDLGIGRANLALARPIWLPSALTEGAFMMIPEQEAALRAPVFQEAYARGVVEGIRRFLLGRIIPGRVGQEPPR